MVDKPKQMGYEIKLDIRNVSGHISGNITLPEKPEKLRLQVGFLIDTSLYTRIE